MLVRPGALLIPRGIQNKGDVAYVAADGAEFDGTNDYLTLSTNLGASDSKLWSGSIWLNTPTASGTIEYIQHGSGVNIWVRSNADLAAGKWLFRGQGATTANVLQVQTDSRDWTGLGWYHLMWSFDVSDAAKMHLYVNGVDETNVDVRIDEALDFSSIAAYTMGSLLSSLKLGGCMQEFWFAPGQYIDLSVEANRLKFRTAAGKPENLGSDGSTPTGTAPALYLNNPFGSFETDKSGNSNDFTVVGALADCGSSP